MVVDVADWVRIRKAVERLGDPLVEWAIAWAGIAVGVVLALLTIELTLHTTTSDPQTGLRTGLWVGMVAGVLFAICFGAVGLRERKRHGASSRGVCEDMDDVAERMGLKGLGATEKAPRIGFKRQILRIWLGDLQ